MKKVLIVLAIGFAAFAAICGFLAILLIGSFNSMTRLDQASTAAWSQVENVYQRRFDLIPNLVETVKATAAFEKDTLTAVTQARASVGQMKVDPSKATPAELEAFSTAQQGLGTALSRLMVVSERYPELRATAAFRDLQAQLEGTENRIAVERKAFNDAVIQFNTSVVTFPNNLLAPRFGFSVKPYFKVQDAAATNAVKVNFGK